MVLIDIGLKDEAEGGFELCRELRSRSQVLPIVFLSARDSDLDVISGLRLGADDYLTKNVSLPHLMARVAALMRRVKALTESDEEADIVERGLLRLDSDRLRATWNGVLIDLTVTEFWIVYSLARYPGHVKRRAQLMDDANIVVDDSTITSHIKRIRRKFESVDNSFDCIESVYAAGYRWRSSSA